MTLEQLTPAIEEAKRFLRIAEDAKEVLEGDKYACYRSPQTAAAKRASMDLTRALANMRRTPR